MGGEEWKEPKGQKEEKRKHTEASGEETGIVVDGGHADHDDAPRDHDASATKGKGQWREKSQ